MLSSSITYTVERTRWISTLVSLFLMNEIVDWAWIRDIHTYTCYANSNSYAMSDYMIYGRTCLPEKEKHRMFKSLAHALHLVLKAHITWNTMCSCCSARLHSSEENNILLLRYKKKDLYVFEIFERKKN